VLSNRGSKFGGKVFLVIWLCFGYVRRINFCEASKLTELLDRWTGLSVGIPPFLVTHARKRIVQIQLKKIEINLRIIQMKLSIISKRKKNQTTSKRKKQNEKLNEKLNVTIDDVHFFIDELDQMIKPR